MTTLEMDAPITSVNWAEFSEDVNNHFRSIKNRTVYVEPSGNGIVAYFYVGRHEPVSSEFTWNGYYMTLNDVVVWLSTNAEWLDGYTKWVWCTDPTPLVDIGSPYEDIVKEEILNTLETLTPDTDSFGWLENQACLSATASDLDGYDMTCFGADMYDDETSLEYARENVAEWLAHCPQYEADWMFWATGVTNMEALSSDENVIAYDRRLRFCAFPKVWDSMEDELKEIAAQCDMNAYAHGHVR